MVSRVEIANLALIKVGTQTVTSIESTAPEEQAQVVSKVFDHVLQSELRARAWNFSITRVQLAADVNKTIFDDLYQFPLPVDCLRPIKPKGRSDWIIEGRKILTAEAGPLNLRYIANITDMNVLDAMFREAFACRLAFMICDKITKSNTKKQMLADEYRQAIFDARVANSFEKLPNEMPEDDWLLARY